MTEEEKLIKELENYAEEQKLELSCAMEMLCNDNLTEEQRRWLTDFVHRWEKWERGDVA